MLKKSKRMILLAKIKRVVLDFTNILNLRQSSLNGILIFAFRFISLVMIPITLSLTTSDDFSSMTTSSILFQLTTTIFIGTIQKQVFGAKFRVRLSALWHTIFVNFIVFVFLSLIVNYLISNIHWINAYIINLGLLEAFIYSIFNGWIVSSMMRIGNFKSVRRLQLVDFFLIGPSRLVILYFTNSIICWAIAGLLVRIGQLIILSFLQSFTRFGFNAIEPAANDVAERKEGWNFDYAIINLSFWVLLNVAPLISLSFCPSKYIEALQVTMAIAGILGTILTQISNALIPIYLNNPKKAIEIKILRQFSLLAILFVFLGAPFAFAAVSSLLYESRYNFKELLAVYILINLIFGFISLFQVSGYGSSRRTKFLRNGCVLSVTLSVTSSFYAAQHRTYEYLPVISFLGFLFLAIYLYLPSKFRNEDLRIF